VKESLIFFDIDGTLVDEEKKVPKTAKEAIFRLRELGHEVAIATGRAPFMFEWLRKELDIHTYVSFNGQLVVVKDEIIFTNPLKNEALHTLSAAAEKNNHPMIFVGHDGMGSTVSHHDYIVESLDSLKLPNYGVHDPDYFKERDIFQSMIFLQEPDEAHYEREFKDFRFIRWHPLSVDIDPAGGSKAKGIEKAMEYLQYSRNQLYAFGDELNDLEMLSFVPNSVAMGNANPAIKKVAKYVTKSVSEDGIYHGLKMVGLL
jgi:Cof subfamily protein (haloacid dehalogenase superfamily)